MREITILTFGDLKERHKARRYIVSCDWCFDDVEPNDDMIVKHWFGTSNVIYVWVAKSYCNAKD